MELVRTIMINIVMLLFFTTMIDLLLPADQFRSYIKMAMGLMSVLILLHPVIQLLQLNPVTSFTQNAIMATTQGTNQQKEQLMDAYEKRYLSQVETQYKTQAEQQTVALLTLAGYCVDHVVCRTEPQFTICIQLQDWNEQDRANIQSALSGYFGIDPTQVELMTEGSTNS